MAKTKKSWLPKKGKAFGSRDAKSGRIIPVKAIVRGGDSAHTSENIKSETLDFRGKSGRIRTKVSGHLKLANGDNIVTVRKDVMDHALDRKPKD